MNVAATSDAVVLERGDGFGRAATRFRVVAAGLIALLMLGVVSGAVEAREVTTTLGQNDFVGACRAGGGTPKRIRTHVVRCTTADGTVVTCDFNTSPASCTLPFKQDPTDVTLPIDGGVLDVSQPEPSGPKAGGVVVAPTGGVLAQPDPTPSPEVQVEQPVVADATAEGMVLPADPTAEAVILLEADEEKP